jgi:hypothetical protein
MPVRPHSPPRSFRSPSTVQDGGGKEPFQDVIWAKRAGPDANKNDEAIEAYLRQYDQASRIQLLLNFLAQLGG